MRDELHRQEVYLRTLEWMNVKLRGDGSEGGSERVLETKDNVLDELDELRESAVRLEAEVGASRQECNAWYVFRLRCRPFYPVC